jgi:hypothetical protein
MQTCGTIFYNMYASVFACRRGCIRFFFQEDAPRKTLTVEIPLPETPWLYISAIWDDGQEDDVTEIVEELITPNEVITSARLFEMTKFEPEQQIVGKDSVVSTRKLLRWSYMDSTTFEVREITSDGLVNAVKPKTD